MGKYKNLVIECEQLKETFTNHSSGLIISNDLDRLDNWIENCILEVEKDGLHPDDADLYDLLIECRGNADKVFLHDMLHFTALLKGESIIPFDYSDLT